MSTYTNRLVACPACGDGVEREIAQGLNAERSPSVRRAILRGSFQRFTCDACEADFLVDSPLVYVDWAREEFMWMLPGAWESNWRRHEVEARALYERNTGAGAPPALAEVVTGVQVRAVFGLDALREKILIRSEHLDDHLVELLKLLLLRDPTSGFVLSAQQRPRLVRVDAEALVLHAPHDLDGALGYRALSVPRARYTELATRRGEYGALLGELEGCAYVDLGRLLIPGDQAPSIPEEAAALEVELVRHPEAC